MWPTTPFNQWGQQVYPQFTQSGILGPHPVTQAPAQQLQQHGKQTYKPTTDFAAAFNTMTLCDPSDNNWYMDSGATAHLSNSAGILKSIFNPGIGKSVTVANGRQIPITKSGSFSFASKTRPLSLKSVLVTPSIIKNLISVRRFTKDNAC